MKFRIQNIKEGVKEVLSLIGFYFSLWKELLKSGDDSVTIEKPK